MNVTINGCRVSARPGRTILDTARENDVYIPNLCSHPELTSYGGCRLCIVEVEGMKGYPTACTTAVKNGMKIQTDTRILRDMRREIIQLMLSDHPTGCLLCEDEEECGKSQTSIRKAGATTGCRWCPNDEDCELQDVVKHHKIDEIIFPVYYQGFSVEKNDPFFDRDYNLCIYCGRCVRICQQHRKSHIIYLNQRGKDVMIGPAYQMSHIEAGCEFCGACISICPTGANFEKNRKWAGKADGYRPAVCSFCGMNCEYQLVLKDRKVIGTIPPGDPHQSGGELCVKGRFCFSELITSPYRLEEPIYRFPGGTAPVPSGDAWQRAARLIRQSDPGKTAMYLSPSLTLEEIEGCRRFAERILKTTWQSSSVLNSNSFPFAGLASRSCTVEEVEQADRIVSIYLNGNYNYGPLTLAIKRAAERGVPYYQLGCFDDTTSRYAEDPFNIPAGKEYGFLSGMQRYLETGTGGNAGIRALADGLKAARVPCLVVGHYFLDITRGGELLEIIRRIADLLQAKVFVANPVSHIIELAGDPGFSDHHTLEQNCRKGQVELLYIVGDDPFSRRPGVKNIIFQGAFPPDDRLAADLVLPSALPGETGGSVLDFTGQTRQFSRSVRPPSGVNSNLDIFSRIARNCGDKETPFTLKDLRMSSEKRRRSIPDFSDRKPAKRTRVLGVDPKYPLYLVIERSTHRYQNISLARISEGMNCIYPDNTLMVNPADASRLGIQNDTTAEVQFREGKTTLKVHIRKIIREGFLLLVRPREDVYPTNPCPVHLGRP